MPLRIAARGGPGRPAAAGGLTGGSTGGLTAGGSARHPAGRMIALPARSDLIRLLRRAALLFVAVWLVRSLAFGAVAVDDRAMQPQLRPGDVLLVAKWPYGWSRHGLVGGAPLFAGRLAAAMPARGDVVVIRDRDGASRVRRVIGLPGDRIGLRAGAVLLDGRRLPRWRVGDLLLPVTPGRPCGGVRREPAGCRYRRFAEMLPEARSHAVLDSAPGASDDLAARRVPAGQLFLIGDNRDESRDSRTAVDAGGMGMMPADRLLGRAGVLIWSTDGSARWLSPGSWWRATRWRRIGAGVD